MASLYPLSEKYLSVLVTKMQPIEAAADFAEDCLPPESQYTSRDALLKAASTWAAQRGYAFVTRRTTTLQPGRKTLTLACDRSCRPPDASQ